MLRLVAVAEFKVQVVNNLNSRLCAREAFDTAVGVAVSIAVTRIRKKSVNT